MDTVIGDCRNQISDLKDQTEKISHAQTIKGTKRAYKEK